MHCNIPGMIGSAIGECPGLCLCHTTMHTAWIYALGLHVFNPWLNGSHLLCLSLSVLEGSSTGMELPLVGLFTHDRLHVVRAAADNVHGAAHL